MATTVVTPRSFGAWFRPRGGEWRKLLEAASRASAFDALLDETKHLSGDLVVLPAGEHPAGNRVADVNRNVIGRRPVAAALCPK
jgi:hypothetical protein